jgi:hypothetical protein
MEIAENKCSDMVYRPRRSFDALAELGETGALRENSLIWDEHNARLSSAHRRHAIGAFNRSQPACACATTLS